MSQVIPTPAEAEAQRALRISSVFEFILATILHRILANGRAEVLLSKKEVDAYAETFERRFQERGWAVTRRPHPDGGAHLCFTPK